jgi:hypothetical protein
MLQQDTPTFANWDQDTTALAERYAEQDPGVVAEELGAAAAAAAATYAGVSGEAWNRTGIRSNGTHFTVAGISRYHLHDVVHHLADVGPVRPAGLGEGGERLRR